MSTLVERKNLELSVRDFGPIARADIDLRPMTVFVGPSNTGKSYLAILIYALHRFFDDYTHDNRILHSISDQGVSDEHISELILWINSVYSESAKRIVSTEDTHIPVADSVSVFLRPFLHFIKISGDLLHGEIARCFGMADTNRLVRHSSRNGARISMKRRFSNQSTPIEPFEYEFVISRKGYEFIPSIPDKTPLFFEDADHEEIEDLRESASYVRRSLSQTKFSEDWRSESVFLINHILRLVESYIRYPLDQPAHYLPSDRAGIMHTQRVAVGALIRRASYAGIQREESQPILSGVLADFLRQLGELDISLYSHPRLRQTKSELAKHIEENVLRGAVRYENSVTGYPMFYYRPDGWKEDIPLMNTSSSVSELAPVALYLRHVVRPGETLIIEEPESHLHPAMQVEFTRQLAAVVRAGVRVIITTHSEWVLDELANLVRLSGLPKSRREGIGGADYALTPEQLGVWLFEPKNRPRGSVVKEIPFDEEFGGFRSGFSEVAMGTYNDHAAISNRLGRSGS